MVQIYNYHDAKMAAIGGFNCNGNKSTVNAMSTYTGSSSIGDYPPVFMSSCCCGGGSLWAGGLCGAGGYSVIGPQTFNAADTVGANSIYGSTDTAHIGRGIRNQIFLGIGNGLASALSNPNTVMTLGGAALNGVGNIFGNLGNAIAT